MSTWPPRWDGPQFKTPGSRKVKRGLKREARENVEDSKKAKVRFRDKYCRFPLCGCKRFQLALHVSHKKHKGMGGNPKEDRSAPALMVLVCSARHRENVFSIDRGTLRWRALTPRGSDGPIAWDISLETLRRQTLGPLMQLAVRDCARAKWMELAVERDLHVYEPASSAQSVILAWLRGMEQ